jgi:hypothetical protein
LTAVLAQSPYLSLCVFDVAREQPRRSMSASFESSPPPVHFNASDNILPSVALSSTGGAPQFQIAGPAPDAHEELGTAALSSPAALPTIPYPDHVSAQTSAPTVEPAEFAIPSAGMLLRSTTQVIDILSAAAPTRDGPTGLGNDMVLGPGRYRPITGSAHHRKGRFVVDSDAEAAWQRQLPKMHTMFKELYVARTNEFFTANPLISDATQRQRISVEFNFGGAIGPPSLGPRTKRLCVTVEDEYVVAHPVAIQRVSDFFPNYPIDVDESLNPE